MGGDGIPTGKSQVGSDLVYLNAILDEHNAYLR